MTLGGHNTMNRVERICIDLMMSLKNGECNKNDLEGYKELIFEQAMTAVHGGNFQEKIEKYLDK